MSKWLCFGRRKPVVIETWDCSHMSLTDLPPEVWDHRATLRQLNLSCNSIKDIPKSVFHLDRLEELNLCENEVLFLPPAVAKLEFLTMLILSKNSLSSIPDAIKECKSLLTLDLSCNPIGDLCEGLMELRQLRKLLINDIQLEELPSNIGKLDKLEILELRENLLQNLPASISHLSLLERLDLGTNEFTSVSPSIGSLESLSELWLDMNTINIIPEEICHLHNLKFLELSENHLMLLPEGMGGWGSMTHLYLDSNLISLIPPSLNELHKLSILKMDSNRIGSLPEVLDGLVSITELGLAHNHISDLPPSIGCMTNLFHLNLDENMLTELPPEIGQCTSLSILSLRNNQLMEVPGELAGLTRLSILTLVGNQLPHLPYSLTNLKSLTAIWISENQSRPIVDLQLAQDERGDKCLTCFLFPQQGAEPAFQEGASSPVDSAIDFDGRVVIRKASQVNFDPKVLDKPSSKISRDLTPFPKELHSKAMQWRATRDITVGGGEGAGVEGAVGAEGGDVIFRKRVNSRTSNRNSLLKALSNPLDEDNLLPRSSGSTRRGRQNRSSSREGTPHPPTIPEQEGEELGQNHTGDSALYNHTHQPNRNGYSNPVSPTSKTSSDTLSPLPPPIYSPDGSVVESMVSPSRGCLTKNGEMSENFQTGYERNPPHMAVTINNNNSNNNNNNNNNNNVTTVYLAKMNESIPTQSYVQPSAKEPAKYDEVVQSHSHSLSEHLHFSMESGFVGDNEQENSQPWYTSPENSPKVASKSESVAAQAISTPKVAREKGQEVTPPCSTSEDYSHIVWQQGKATPPLRKNTAGVVSRERPEESYQPCYPPSTTKMMGARSLDNVVALGTRIHEDVEHKGGGSRMPDDSLFHDYSQPIFSGSDHSQHGVKQNYYPSEMGVQSRHDNKPSLTSNPVYSQLQHGESPRQSAKQLAKDHSQKRTHSPQSDRTRQRRMESGVEEKVKPSAGEQTKSEKVASRRQGHLHNQQRHPQQPYNRILPPLSTGSGSYSQLHEVGTTPLPVVPESMQDSHCHSQDLALQQPNQRPIPGWLVATDYTRLSRDGYKRGAIQEFQSNWGYPKTAKHVLSSESIFQDRTPRYEVSEDYKPNPQQLRHLLGGPDVSRSVREHKGNGLALVRVQTDPEVVAKSRDMARATGMEDHTYQNLQGCIAVSGSDASQFSECSTLTATPTLVKKGVHRHSGSGHGSGQDSGIESTKLDAPRSSSAPPPPPSHSSDRSPAPPPHPAHRFGILPAPPPPHVHTSAPRPATPSPPPAHLLRSSPTPPPASIHRGSPSQPSRSPHVRAMSPLSITGTKFRVMLKKEPTLGLGLTGGKDGENTLKPGHKGFHVYKVIDNLPAKKSGKIQVGDQLLEVNGIDVAKLTNHELLAILTGQRKTFYFLFFREASLTLL